MAKTWNTGYVQVYTGDGKGKTSAALGAALRAAGAGLHVFFAQFLKAGHTSEVAALERFGGLVNVRTFGHEGFIQGLPDEEDVASAHAGLNEIRAALTGGEYDLVILDEANDAVTCGVLEIDDLLGLLDARPDDVELIITGRGAMPALTDRADLVTEMVDVKHYYARGVTAREGIEQ
jgi:cob(I)alamin adenosyltransferase